MSPALNLNNVASTTPGEAPSNPPTILVTGAGGQLGRELVAIGASGVDRRALDLAQPSANVREQALRLFDDVDVVINAAAFTAVDDAEDPSRRELVKQVNADAPGILAEVAARVGARFIQVSTDYVFPGVPPVSGREWRASDTIDAEAALNQYGWSKALGEDAARSWGATVVRTAWVWSGPHTPGRDFVSTMVSLALQGASPKVVNDQTGRPTFAPDLAAGLWSLAHDLLQSPAAGTTLHFTNSGAPVTWYGFARAIFSAVDCDPDLVTPCDSAQWPTPAQRPAWSVLDLEEWPARLGVPPQWTDSLARGLRGMTEGVD